MLVPGLDTRNIDLLPLNGYVVRFEDSLYRLGDFCTNTIPFEIISVQLKSSKKGGCCDEPGMRVVVYFPPYLVGLKMSDCTVAIAAHAGQSQGSLNIDVVAYS